MYKVTVKSDKCAKNPLPLYQPEYYERVFEVNINIFRLHIYIIKF